MDNQFMGYPNYQPAMFFANTPFATEPMAMAMFQDLLNHISYKDLTLARYRTAQKVFKALQGVLMNQQPPKPSKDEFKNALDVLCEIRKETATTQAQRENIERDIEGAKLFLDWFMPD